MTEPTDKSQLGAADEQQLDEYLKGDSSVSRQYQQLHGAEVPASLDRLVLNQAREAVKKTSQRPAWMRWSGPFAVAASAVLALAIVIEAGLRDETMVVSTPLQKQQAPFENRSIAEESVPAPAEADSPPRGAEPGSVRLEMPAPPPEATNQSSPTPPPAAPSPAASPTRVPTPAPASSPPATPAPTHAPAPAQPARAPAPAVTPAAERTARARSALPPSVPAPSANAYEPRQEISKNAVENGAGAASQEQAAQAAKRDDEALAAAAEAELKERQAAALSAMGEQRDLASVARTTVDTRAPVAIYSRNVSADMPVTAPYSDPEQWLKDIRQLRKENKQEQADAEWRRFRTAFPNYQVAESDIARATDKETNK